MSKTHRLIAIVSGFIVIFALIPGKSTAQDLASPTVGGLSVHCTDASGAVVYTRFLPTLSDIAISTIDPATGERLILINFPAASQMPPLLQLFIYAHECGHHISGDVIAGVLLHENNLNREKTADMIGIRILRDQLGITAAQADALATVFRNNPPMFPYYLPGPLRAQWISNCYATNDNTCTH
jgi:hypothetical protein